MFIIDWVFDKMGYTKKKVATKRTPAVKKTTVRKKNV
jgi:hypothetical protein